VPATLSCGGTLPDVVFSRQDILDNLREVAEILGAGGQPQTRLIVVGGSYLALHGLRDATRDVDTITVLDDAVNSAVHEATWSSCGRSADLRTLTMW
jgi:hypothetical protein